MSIRAPRPVLSTNDKKLLLLLAQLVTEQNLSPRGTNSEKGKVTLSDTEAEELIALLSQYLNSRPFLEGSAFVEGVVSARTEEGERRMRELYLSARKLRGRARALASKQWAEFQLRLGTVQVSVNWRSSIERMDSDYFLAMEQKLLETLRLDPRVIALVMSLVQQRVGGVEELRSGARPIRHGAVRRALQQIVEGLGPRQSVANRQIATTQIVGAITIVSDIGVLFTTRDWGVAGTLSTLAAAGVSTVRK